MARRRGKQRHGPVQSRGMGRGHSKARAGNAMHGQKGNPIVSPFAPAFSRGKRGRKRGRGKRGR
jgi:hypothetical protein